MSVMWVGAGIAAVGVGASVYSANKASGAQTDAANQANATQQAQYDQTRTDNMPWKTAGATAIGQLSTGTQAGGQFTKSFSASDFQADPGYAFRLQQGQDALDNSSAAHGGVLSGAQLKASDQYNQGFASNEYSNAYNRFNTDQANQFNRLSSVAGTGQVANNTVAASGTNAANQIGSNTIGAGNAQASGYVGQTNALNAGLGQLANAYGQSNALSSFAPNANGASTNALTSRAGDFSNNAQLYGI